MKINTITMPVNANYLIDFMSELPIGIFNKKVTNTGATSLVLENTQDIILISPVRKLIKNKIRQYPNQRCPYILFAVHDGITTENVIDYIESCKGKQPVKIISTPDSLYKITGINGIFENYHLVIDEFHQLLEMVNNRERAALSLLDEFTNFKKYTFLSATPIEEDFLPYPLNTLEYHNLNISNFERIKAVPKQTDKPFSAVVDIIKNFKIKGELLINGHSSKHLYFYLNTVNNICNIIKASGLKAEDVNIVCAETPYNARKLESVGCEVGDFITEEDLKSNPLNEPPIHFITSSGHLGSDVYSNDGVVIVVTNCHVKSTITGISTLQQISGRIRTKSNPYNGILYHIFNTNKSALSNEEFKAEQQLAIDESLEIITGWETVTKVYKDSIIRDMENSDVLEYTFYHYLGKDGTMKLNDLKIKWHQYIHNLENQIYSTGIEVRKAYQEQGFDVISTEFSRAESEINNVASHVDFKSYCQAYNEFKTAPFYIGEPLFGCPEKTKKLIMLAFEKLDYSKIQALKFHQTRIKDHLARAVNFNKYGITKAIKMKVKIGGIYSKSEIQIIIQSIYDRLKLQRTAKSTDLKEYFDYNECKLANGNKGIKMGKPILNLVQKQDGLVNSIALSSKAA